MFQEIFDRQTYRIFFLVAIALVSLAAIAGTTTRVSVTYTGQQALYGGHYPEISADGRYVAFESGSPDLTSSFFLGNHIYRYDRLTHEIMLVSVSSTGQRAAIGLCSSPSISADGRYIAFFSEDSNLDADGTPNTHGNVFVHDCTTGLTERVSVTEGGQEASGQSNLPAISADGRYVAFISWASDLVPDDTNGKDDIFVYDRLTGRTERVSVASDGQQANNDARYDTPSMSADGRYVAFSSEASNLVPNDTNGKSDIFVYDRLLKRTTRVNVTSGGQQAEGDISLAASISASGRFVSFTSFAANLVPNDTNNTRDIFVHDCLTGETELASVNSDGEQGIYGSYKSVLNTDGRFVAFTSMAMNLIPEAPSSLTHVYVRDRVLKTTIRVSVASDGTIGNLECESPSISADGSCIAFQSMAANLVPPDTNGNMDCFVHEYTVTPSSYRPDAKIRLAGETSYYGNNIYNTDGTGQRRVTLVSTSTPVICYIQVQNDGGSTDAFRVIGPAAPAGWTLKYYNPQGTEITGQVTDPASGWSTGSLAPQAYTYLRVYAVPGAGVPPGSTFDGLLIALSAADNTRADAVKLSITVRKIQPDAKIRLISESSYLGDNIYTATGGSQTKSSVVLPGVVSTYYVQVQNDGNISDSFAITGPQAPAGWTVKYFNPAGAEITDQVTALTGAGWPTGMLAPQAYTYVRVTIQPDTGVLPGSECTLLLTARSLTDATKKDAVKIVIATRKLQPDARIRLSSDSAYLGDNIYNGDGTDQTRATASAAAVSFYVQVQNDGNVTDSFTVTAPIAPAGWTVRYYNPGGADITGQVTNPSAGWSTGTLAVQSYTYLRIVIQAGSAVPAGSICALLVTARSVTNTACQDAAIARVGKSFPPGTAPGEERLNPKDNAVMVWVPAGNFVRGSQDGIGWSEERPQRSIFLNGFWIYKYEVTVAQYRAFCAATTHTMPDFPTGYSWTGKTGWSDPALQNHPIVCVTWNDAQAYATWASVTLPTEAQWEKAARGTDGRNFSWGGIGTIADPENGWNQTRCANMYNSEQAGLSTWPVGSFPTGASPYGAQDMAGNAWEWCADWYDENYYNVAPSTNPTGPATGTTRVLRGGSWGNNDDDFRCASRFDWDPAEQWSQSSGFRCATSQ